MAQTGRERDLRDTLQLYEWVWAHDASLAEVGKNIGIRIAKDFIYKLPTELFRPFANVISSLMIEEAYLWETPPPDFDRMNLRELTEYRALLFQKQHYLKNREAFEELLFEGLSLALYSIGKDLPQAESPSPFTIPLVYTLDEPGLLIDRIFATLCAPKFEDRGIFKGLTDQMWANIQAASGRTSSDSKKPLKLASKSGLPPDELVATYLTGTPFADVFRTPVPLKFTTLDRMNHMHVIGNTGSGKSTLLANLIINDIKDPAKPSVVVIEPTGDLVRTLQRADLGIEDRLIIIDPQDPIAPALNPFALKSEANETARERARAYIVQTFNFLISALAGGTADLTSKQGILFEHIAEALLAFPRARDQNATVLDLFRFLQDPLKYKDVVDTLPDFTREFFEEDLFQKGSEFTKTRKEIAYRLRGVLLNPAVRRLLSAPETKLDLKHALDNGYVILVDTARDHLATGSPVFGKLFISLILQTILQRADPGASRHPAYIYIDECSDYFDTSVNEFLNQARKYNCGVILAHRQLEETTSQALKASLLTNPGIRFASRISVADARQVAPNMRTTPEFIMGQPRYTWAAYIQDVTPHAVAIPTRPSPLEHAPRLTYTRYEELLAKNRAKVGIPASYPEPPRAAFVQAAEVSTPEEDGDWVKWGKIDE